MIEKEELPSFQLVSKLLIYKTLAWLSKNPSICLEAAAGGRLGQSSRICSQAYPQQLWINVQALYGAALKRGTQ